MSSRKGIHKDRSAARRRAVQILYQSDVTQMPVADILNQGLCVDEIGPICDFTRLLLEGVGEHIAEIDEFIASISEHWSLDRMPLVDKSILRLAAFEMYYVEEVPISVSINEAVEIAKGFGGEDDSSRFVNGVLGRLADRIESGAINGRE